MSKMLCYCNEEVFTYKNVSIGIRVDQCARTSYVLAKSVESKLIFKEAVDKKPCSYKKVTDMSPPGDIDIGLLVKKLDSFSIEKEPMYIPNQQSAELLRLLGLDNFQINRNYLMWYLITYRDPYLSYQLVEETLQKIKEIDTMLLKNLHRMLIDFKKNPSYSYICEIAIFFEKYTLTPKEYISGILEQIYNRDGRIYIVKFYKWSQGFYEYLVKNGLCYVPPVFYNNVFDKELVVVTPEFRGSELKKGFQMPPLVLEEGTSRNTNRQRNDDDDELFESDDENDSSQESDSDSDKANDEVSDYNKSDSDSEDSSEESEESEDSEMEKEVESDEIKPSFKRSKNG